MNVTIVFFNKVRQESTLAGKITLLKEKRSDFYDEIVRDALDKSVTYGITSKGIEIQPHTSEDHFNGWYDTFHRILGRLASRELTGNDAIETITECLREHNEEEQRFFLQILDRDLNLGISWDTYRSEVMGLNDQFEVALAQHLEKAKGVNPVNGEWFASRKCDGCRCIAIIRDGEVEFRSRQNKVFTTLDNLKPAVANFVGILTGEWVLDGELCKIDANGDEDFQSVMKEIRKKDYSIESCCYQVFDVLTYDEFRLGKTHEAFANRLALLCKLNEAYSMHPHGDCWVQPLKQERLTCQADFDRWAGYVEAGNWEGFMLRKDVPYQSGRTKDLLKVKKFEDFEAQVDSIEIGKMSTSLPGRGNVEYEGVAALHITYEGNDVKVGTGLSREQRIAWMNDPSLIVGKVITVKYFERTVNQQGKASLRFPTLKVVHGDVRDT